MRRGDRYERELVRMLWNAGFAAVRVPASGAMSFPLPDVIAGNGKRYLAMEVKMRSALPLYITTTELEALIEFSKLFGAEPFVAIRIPKSDWRFVHPEELKRTRRGYKVDDDVYLRGLDFDELVRGITQKRLFE